MVSSLANYVSRLRKAIGADRLRLEPAGYVLHVDPERFDLARFDRLVAEARVVPARQRATLLREALALWRGEPLEDLAFEEFAQREIAQLQERLVNAIETRIDADLELGAGAELVDELEELIATYPLRERLRAQRMLALYRTGRQADALETYRDARRVLADELGIEPSEELRVLERRILEQDPALLTDAPSAVPIESRRTVTILFCDVVDSTRLATTLDAEAYRRLMSSYYDVVRQAVEQHGGAVEKFIGDAVLALFGVPELHEDDALRAIRAAIAARDTVDIPVRIAVNTGEVVTSVEGDGPPVTGAAVNIAAHMEARAAAREIVLGAQTYALVRDGVRATPVDLGDGLHAWRLEELIGGVQHGRRFDAPLVGRKEELRKLRAAFQRAREEEFCTVATVVGEAGIGKTRLARELVDSVKEHARVLVGRCGSYGAGATFLPVAEIVRQAAPEASIAGIASLLAGEDDAAEVARCVAAVIGAADAPAAPGEAFWAVRRLLEVLAREKPLVVVFDDVHWAEPTLLDLVEYLGDWADGPICVLCLGRRELLESRPGWGGPTSTGFVVELESLVADDVIALLGELADGSLAPKVGDRIVERAGGNPLFAEQLLDLASEAPHLALDQAPPTIEALIASRLDLLAPRELLVLRRASVIGRRFTRTEIEELASDPFVELRSLERRGHVHAIPEGFRFHHVLVRDVAYRGIPKVERADLHKRVAEHLDRHDGADEIVGYHLEQAHRYRVEAGLADSRAQELAAAAGERLGRAGIRAWKRADVTAATNLIGRATALLPEVDGEHRELLCEFGTALRGAGQWERASEVLEQAVEKSLDANDRGAELRARIELAHLRSHHHMPGDSKAVTDLIELAAAAIPEFEKLGDNRGLGRAWLFLSTAHGNFQLRFAAQEEAAERAIHFYQSEHWSPSTCLSALMNALYYGPRPVGDAIAHSEQLLREHAGDPASEANVLLWLGGLRAMRGQFDEARTQVHRAKMLYEALGLTFPAEDSCAMVLADIEILAGRVELATQNLREACDACIRLNELSYLASRAAQLADAAYSLGDQDEAETWTRVSREKADAEDLHAQASWRGIASRLAARSGDLEHALQLASEARGIVERGDGLNQQAKLELDLAEVYRVAAHVTEARRAIERAIELYEAKENEEAATAARSLLHTSAVS